MARGIRKKNEIVRALQGVENDIEILKNECDEVGAEKCNYSTRFDMLYAKKEVLLWVLKED
jgi:hypothetical protein